MGRNERLRYGLNSDASLRGELWATSLKAGARMRWMELFVSSENSHVGPSALIIFRTEDDVRSMQQLVRIFGWVRDVVSGFWFVNIASHASDL